MHSLPRLATTLLALVLALPAIAFEGRVHFDMKAGKDTQKIVYSLKGDKARFEMPAANVSGIVDGKTQEMRMLMPEQKMYMVISLDTAAQMANKAAPKDVKFEDTGETETVAGRKCRKYRVSDQDSQTDIWASEGMGTFMAQVGGGGGGFMRKGGAQIPAWQRELSSKGYFPLRVVSLNKKGKETYRMEATKVEEQSLPDSVFQTPADYQRLDMGGMMKGLIPGMK